MKTKLKFLFIAPAMLVLLLTLNSQLSTALAQGTAFTYQGQLQNNGAPAGGTYNLAFTLFTTSTGGAAVAGPIATNGVAVTNGLFTVTIDFGSSVWNGQTNWLEIAVETNGASSFTTLAPRQQHTPIPYAINAESAVALGNGVAIGMGIDNTISGPGTAYSFIGGGVVNQIQSSYSVIAGGYDNTIYTYAPYSMIAGGLYNVIKGDTNDYGTSVIAGGYIDVINSNSWNSFIGGGGGNTIGTNSDHSVIVGGYANTIQGVSEYGAIGGGVENSVGGFASAVSGGAGNSIQITSSYSAIAGGYFNSIQTNVYESFIGGGANNVIGPDGFGSGGADSVIGGGVGNAIDEYDSFIGGGQQNVVDGLADHSVIGGGSSNVIVGAYSGPFVASVIGGGQDNLIQTNAYFSFIGGGFGNTIQSNTFYAVIPGGSNNIAGGFGSFAAGTSAQATNNGAFVWSDNSTPSPFNSTAPNQFNVRASGGVQFVPGSGESLTISNDQGLVPGIIVSSTLYSGHMRFRNALEVWPNPAGTIGGYLDVRNTSGTQTIWMSGTNGNITCTTLSTASDRNAKQDFAPISASQILDKVVELPVSEWSYKTDSTTRHIGPVAQHFHAAFGLNGSDDKHITTVDEGGVALAAIQGLNQKLEKQSAENAQLKRENELLTRRMDELEAEVKSLAQKN